MILIILLIFFMYSLKTNYSLIEKIDYLFNYNISEDYEYLWKEIRESYPYYNLFEDITKKNLESIYIEYKEKLNECKSFYDFYLLLSNLSTEFEYIGHFTLIDTSFYNELLSYELYKTKELMEESPNETYLKKLYNMRKKIFKKSSYIYSYISNLEENNNKTVNNKESLPKLTIIDEGETACIQIDSFIISSDYENIFKQYYKKIKNYKNIIFDIRNNSGGSTSYYEKYIIDYLLNNQIKYDETYLLNNTNTNTKFMSESVKKTIKPITHIPIKNLDEKLINSFDSFNIIENVYYPNEEKNIGFNGKIYLLVSNSVYSASEALTYLCKETGFATIIGTNTGGDGIQDGNGGPIKIVLPNSKLIFQFTASIGINSDGTINEIEGTKPDVYLKNGEDALTKCLDIIYNDK